MDFSWTDEQLALRAEMVRCAEDLNNGDEVEDDRDAVFSKEKWQQAAAHRLLGLRIPETFGGRGLSVLDTIAALEGLGYGCHDNGVAFAINGQICIQEPIIHFGSDAQKDRYLPGLADGSLVGAFAFTEPDAGSDLYGITTQATPQNDGYVLNGSKRLITFAPIADVAVVFATVDPAKKQWGLTAFLVDLKSEGVRLSPNHEKMGLRTVPLGEIEFEDCFVPRDSLLGNEGAGLGILNDALGWDRCIMCACQLGAMERQLERCVEFARTRTQFDQPIGKFQSVSNRVAEMKVRLESSRLLLYRTACKKDAGEAILMDGAMTKLHVTECFVQSGLDAIAIHGGTGYLSANSIERDLRDAIGGTIYAGTSDIQRNTIAKLLGL